MFVVSFSMVNAQTNHKNPFTGKKIAFYISKKQFQFTNHYLKPLNYFLSLSDSLDLAEEELKTGTVIRLGLLFTQQWKAAGADSIVFINSEPQLAENWIRSGQIPRPADLSQFDYVFTFASVNMEATVTNSVFAFSNKLISEKIVTRQGNWKIEAWKPLSHANQSIQLQFKETDPVPNQWFVPAEGDSPMTAYFLQVLNRLTQQLL